MAGTEFYHCDIAAVITNSAYTKQANNQAQTSGVRLFGREFLEELIENYDNEYDSLDPENALALIREMKSANKTQNSKSPNQQRALEKKATTKKNQIAKQAKEKKVSIGYICLIVVILCTFFAYELVQIMHFIEQIF